MLLSNLCTTTLCDALHACKLRTIKSTDTRSAECNVMSCELTNGSCFPPAAAPSHSLRENSRFESVMQSRGEGREKSLGGRSNCSPKTF